jgi:protein arginine N-methyltransferase 1
MMRDQVRMSSYIKALEHSVKPGSVVIDIGTGTGVFALIACKLGASHVYAVDPNPLIEIGRAISAANGFADRITFIRDLTTNIEFPEQADVIVGDIRGQLPMLDTIIATYVDARTRLLKPGGTLIPQRDRLYVTLVEEPTLYTEEVMRPWLINDYQLDMSAALPLLVNTPLGKVGDIKPENVLLPAQLWDTIEYGYRTEVSLSGQFRWQAQREGTAHFVYIWFDSDLTDEVSYSNAPGAERARVYGSLLLALTEPVQLQPGNVVTLSLNANPGGRGYLYRWNTCFFADETADQPYKQIQQSTFFSTPLSDLVKRTATYQPRLSSDGRIHAFILAAMERNGSTLEQIARQALEQFPQQLNDYETALARVADLSQAYAE